MTNPSWTQVNGEIAHIRGWKPGSARYDESMTAEERNGFDNLLLLCPKHHKRVDRLEPHRYTVEMLQEMKAKGSVVGPTDLAWADEASLAAFARDAIRQAIQRIVAEGVVVQNEAASLSITAGANLPGMDSASVLTAQGRFAQDRSETTDEATIDSVVPPPSTEIADQPEASADAASVSDSSRPGLRYSNGLTYNNPLTYTGHDGEGEAKEGEVVGDRDNRNN